MKKKSSGMGIIFAIGAALGALLALLLGTDKEGNTKEPVKKGVKQTKVKLEEVKTEKVDPVIEVFGEKTDEAKAAMKEAQENVVTQLAAMKDTLKDLDKKKYKAVVSDVVDDIKSSKTVTKGKLAKLKTYLSKDFEAMKKAAEKSAESKA